MLYLYFEYFDTKVFVLSFKYKQINAMLFSWRLLLLATFQVGEFYSWRLSLLVSFQLATFHVGDLILDLSSKRYYTPMMSQ